MPLSVSFATCTCTSWFELCVRCIQGLFALFVIGIMGNFMVIYQSNGKDISRLMIYCLVVASISLSFAIVSTCFMARYAKTKFTAETALSLLWLVSFILLLNKVMPLACGWNQFNPFGSNACGRLRACLLFQIISCVIWFFSGILFGCLSRILYRRNKVMT